MKTIKAGGAGRGRVTLTQGQPLVLYGEGKTKGTYDFDDFNPLPLLCARIF